MFTRLIAICCTLLLASCASSYYTAEAATRIVLASNTVPSLKNSGYGYDYSDTNSVTLRFGTKPVAGDVLVCGYVSPTSQSDSYSIPGNWFLRAQSTVNNVTLRILTHTVGATDGAYSFSVSGSDVPNGISVSCTEYSGVNASNPISGYASFDSANSTQTHEQTQSLYPTVLGSRPVAFFGARGHVTAVGVSPFHLLQSVQSGSGSHDSWLSASAFDTGSLVTNVSTSYQAKVNWNTNSPVSNGYMVFLNPSGVAPSPSPSLTPMPTNSPTPSPSATPTVAPTASPTPPALHLTNGAFSAPNAYPDSSSTQWVPWASNSVWNTPIASYSPSPTVNSNSSTWMSFYSSKFPIVTAFGLKNASSDFGHPVYFGQNSDPTFRVTCNASYAICSTFSSMQFHIPSYARPASGYVSHNCDGTSVQDCADHHMVAIDQTNNIELDLWRVSSMSSGVINADSATYQNVATGDGLNGYETHSGFRLTAGVIRNQEIVAGNIPHALFLIAPCTSNVTPVYPAIYQGSTDTQCVSNQGPPYGQWLRLNMPDFQIAALNVPTWKKAMYYAAAHYGMFIADTNGNYSFGLQVESDAMYTKAGYTNSDCPTNGAPCTPATAYFNKNYPSYWDGNKYSITLNDVDWSLYGQWLNSPPH